MSNVRSTTRKAMEMEELALESQKSLNEGKTFSERTNATIEEIDVSTNNIDEAITIIDQISFQTNILSLNAAVEAATAVEAGRGFAVVVQEVSNLATRSAETAKDIKNIVELAKEKTKIGKEISSQMNNGYNNLESKIIETTNLIQDVTVSNKEQMQGGGILGMSAIAQLDTMTQKNTVLTSDIINSTKQIDSISLEMNKFYSKKI